MIKQLLLCAAITLLAACSDHKEPSKDTPQVQSAIPPAQLDALQKAGGVEATLQQAEQQRRSDMDSQ